MKSKRVLEIIFQALKYSGNNLINDVQMDSPTELVLTTDDEKGKIQAWVIRSENITEAEAAQNAPI
jgi:hypothetical protein